MFRVRLVPLYLGNSENRQPGGYPPTRRYQSSARPVAKGRIMVAVYEADGLPLHWVIDWHGQLYIVPAAHNGWEKRTPYSGHRESLRKVPDCYLIGLGVAGDRGARPAAS